MLCVSSTVCLFSSVYGVQIAIYSVCIVARGRCVCVCVSCKWKLIQLRETTHESYSHTEQDCEYYY